MTDLLEQFEELERQTADPEKNEILRAPFGYPGGKSRSVEAILPRLPYRGVYVEPFGGSAAVLLSRHKSPLEVYNDRYGGVVAFYRCLRDADKFVALIKRLELTVHSREEFAYCKEGWTDATEDMERAAMWYYITVYSFGSLGRNFGRAVRRSPLAGKIQKKLPMFPMLHERLLSVQIENQDWRQCLRDYDAPDTVFYIDPPYVDVHRGTYKNEMSIEDHRELLATIFNLRGFAAVSGYINPLYEGQDWDARYSWKVFVSMTPAAFTKGNNKEKLKGLSERKKTTEVLWIKECK